jgi:hypothetical protein
VVNRTRNDRRNDDRENYAQSFSDALDGGDSGMPFEEMKLDEISAERQPETVDGGCAERSNSSDERKAKRCVASSVWPENRHRTKF